MSSISGAEVVRRLQRAGFERISQRGSHVTLRLQAPERTRIVIVPLHRELAPGTLASILRQAGMTMADMEALE